MNLPEYLLIAPTTDLPGAGLILSTQTPFYLGRIILFKDESQFLTHEVQYNGVMIARVMDYKISIIYAGSLNKRVNVDMYTKHELKALFEGMALFFYEEKILKHLGYYKKYRL